MLSQHSLKFPLSLLMSLLLHQAQPELGAIDAVAGLSLKRFPEQSLSCGEVASSYEVVGLLQANVLAFRSSNQAQTQHGDAGRDRSSVHWRFLAIVRQRSR